MTKKIALAKFDGKKAEFIREMNSEEIAMYNENCKILSDTNKASWSFHILEQNYFEFMEGIYRDFEDVDLTVHVPWKLIEEKTILANRKLSNFLSSFVSFTDHSKTYLTRKYGKESDEINEFKVRASHFFDTNFGFKFFSKLRDYVIHCGMPMVSLEMELHQNQKVVTLLFDRDDLLNNFTWKAIIKSDLEAQNEFFTVTNLVYESMKCCAQLNQVLKKIESKLLISASKEINNLKDLDSKSCFLIWEENSSPETADIGHIPFHLIID